MLIFEPIEPVDGAEVDRTLVPDEEQSAQDPDLNYFLANDGIKERKKESLSLFGSIYAKATSIIAATSMSKVNNDVQFPPTDFNPYRYENSDQYYATLTNAEKKRISRSSQINQDSRPHLLRLPLLDPLKYEQGSWKDWKSAVEVGNIILGFINSTQISFGENRTDC